MEKKPFLTEAMAQEIIQDVPTPFHVYDEKGIRENARRINKAFSWNKGFKEYFAVKALPNPVILQILKEEGCGVDCSSLTELMLSKAMGLPGSDIMFSSNDTPAEEFAYADKLGAIINLDDFTHIDFLEETIGHIPETISCRYNPGGVFTLSNGIMDNPGDSKYGMTKEQLFEAFKILKSKGAKYFGVHSMTLTALSDSMAVTCAPLRICDETPSAVSLTTSAMMLPGRPRTGRTEAVRSHCRPAQTAARPRPPTRSRTATV